VLLPSVAIDGTRVVHERVTRGALTAEVVVGPDVGETICAGEYGRRFAEQVGGGGLSAFRLDGTPPFYLGLDAGESVQVGVEDDDGVPGPVGPADRLELRLYHVHLPKLAAAGLIAFDDADLTARITADGERAIRRLF